MAKVYRYDELPGACEFIRVGEQRKLILLTEPTVSADGSVTMRCCDEHGELHELEFDARCAKLARFQLLDDGRPEPVPEQPAVTLTDEDEEKERILKILGEVRAAVGKAVKRGKSLEKVRQLLGLAERGCSNEATAAILATYGCTVDNDMVYLPPGLTDPDDLEAWYGIYRELQQKLLEAPEEPASPEAPASTDDETPEDREEDVQRRRSMLWVLEAVLAVCKHVRLGNYDLCDLAAIIDMMDRLRFTAEPPSEPLFADFAEAGGIDPEELIKLLEWAGCEVDENNVVSLPDGLDMDAETAETWLLTVENYYADTEGRANAEELGEGVDWAGDTKIPASAIQVGTDKEAVPVVEEPDRSRIKLASIDEIYAWHMPSCLAVLESIVARIRELTDNK